MIDRYEMKFNEAQNSALQESFKSFYQLPDSPKIERSLIVTKEEFTKFLKSRSKARTQFEAQPSEIDLSFSDFRTPFQFIATSTKFTFGDNKNILLYEELDRPNGLTKSVRCEYQDKELQFPTYFQAEGYVLAEYLGEKIGNSN